MNLQAQDHAYSLSLSTGSMLYKGDLTYKQHAGKLSPDFSLGFHSPLSTNFTLGLKLASGTLWGEDRILNKKDLLTENPNWDRALNFKTNIKSAEVNLRYYPNRSLRLRPYFSTGVGLNQFKVFADLYYGENQDHRYYYWIDGTIRTRPAHEGGGDIIKRDFEYETELGGLQTEAEAHNATAFFIPYGAGLEYDINKRFSVQLNLAWQMVFSDFVDGVSGSYKASYANPEVAYAANPSDVLRKSRGNANGKNDNYFFPSVGVVFYLGKTKTNQNTETTFTDELDEIPEIEELSPEQSIPPPAVVRDTIYLTKVDTIFKLIDGQMIPSQATKDGVTALEKSVKSESLRDQLEELNQDIDVLKKRYNATSGKTQFDETREDPNELVKADVSADEISENLEDLSTSLDMPETASNNAQPASAQIITAEDPDESDEDFVPNMTRPQTQTEALQMLYTQLTRLNGEMGKLKDRNVRFRRLLNGGERIENRKSPDGGIGLIFPALSKEIIHFNTGQYLLTEQQRDRLEPIVSLLERYPNLGIVITGHTDRSGNALQNYRLSKKRAEIVKEFLLSHPLIQAHQIFASHFGPALSTAQAGQASSSSDRRVEIDYMIVR